jgi:mannose-1-phosphate guanylyltransferase/mannose-6-phosphate isomerase
MTIKVIPAIMSGGAGTRLWPLSRDTQPKQFLPLAGDDTMIQATALRFAAGAPGVAFLPPIVIANAAHHDLVMSQLASVGIVPAAVILEPMGRNTAATALLAADAAALLDPEALVLLTPADHRVRDPGAFRAAVARAAPFARERICTFGIVPDGPETGYGYIQRGAPLGDGVFAIRRFKEKPQAPEAAAMLVEGGFDWNAGIFLFAPALLVREFGHAADIRDTVRACSASAVTDHAAGCLTIRLDPQGFAAVPSRPIDIAIMEKTAHAAVVPCDIGWTDVGSWASIWQLSPHDKDGNHVAGAVSQTDNTGALLISDGIPLLVSGVEDVVVIATRAGVLVLPRSRAQDVRALLEALPKPD